MAIQWKLGETFSGAVEIPPMWSLKRPRKQTRTETRSKSGKLFLHRWNNYQTFSLPIEFIESADATTINDWWAANTELTLFIQSGDVWDLTTATYENKTIASIGINGNSLFLKSDGLTLFIAGDGDVKTYTLTTAFDISTASLTATDDLSGQTTGITGISFSTDGSKMYIVGTNDFVYESDLSTNWLVSTFALANAEDVSGQCDTLRDVAFGSSGTKMYLTNISDSRTYQYTLSSAWDTSSATYDTKFMAWGSDVTSIFFELDGLTVFASFNNSNLVKRYVLSSAWDISTASDDNNQYNVAAEETSMAGVVFDSDGKKMYICGFATDSAYQYELADIEYQDCMILNEQEPLSQFNKPYEDLYKGTLKLEERTP
jgi:hypothetical protein